MAQEASANQASKCGMCRDGKQVGKNRLGGSGERASLPSLIFI